MLHFTNTSFSGHSAVWGQRTSCTNEVVWAEQLYELAALHPAPMPGQHLGGIGIYRTASGQPAEKLVAGKYLLGSYSPLIEYASGSYGLGVNISTAAAALVFAGVYGVTSSVSVSISGVSANLPALSGVAYGGANVTLAVPALMLTSAGTVMNIGALNAFLPALTLSSAGTVSGMAGAALILSGGYAVAAYSGASAALALQGYYGVAGSVLVGGTAGAALALGGMYLVRSSSVAGSAASIDAVLPALQIISGARADMMLSRASLRATGTVV